MKQLHFKLIESSAFWRKGRVHLWRISACMAIVGVSLLAGCSDKDISDEMEDVTEKYDSKSGKVTLKQISAASQRDRVSSVVNTRVIQNKEALTWVATIKNPTYQAENKMWSASAIAIDNAKKKVYVTWHSDRQATNEATAWGGALDVIDITEEDKPKMNYNMTYSPDMKFNHVYIHDDSLFLGATSNQIAGAVGRLKLTADGEIPENAKTIDRIGFPGTSVNAVAAYGGGLIAVSGHAQGTYATFAPDVEARPYYYGKKKDLQEQNVIEPLYKEMEEFGGKFIATDENGEVYVLHNVTGKKATIIKVNGGGTIELDTTLKSGDKAPESYDEVTGEWIVGNSTSDFYGKHTFAVHGGYAYVACGKSGLRVYDLNTGKNIWKNENYTSCVCTDGEYVYAATGIGLRIYRIEEEEGEKKLALIAFEVENYDEEGGTGAPIIKDAEGNTLGAATTGSKTDRHSPNYVAVNLHKDCTYIYIAYGQSGVRVYKFTPSEFLVELDPYIGVELEPEFGL